MPTPSIFLAVVFALLAYIALLNYLYFRVVLPELEGQGGMASPSGLPSVQLAQFAKVAEALRERAERSWHYYVLRSAYPVGIAWLLILLLITAYLLARAYVSS